MDSTWKGKRIRESVMHDKANDAFAGGPQHLAYSSFTHINDMNSLSFAVGLRPGEEKGEDLVSRMLPLSKIEPGQAQDRKTRTFEVKEALKREKEPCTRPDCQDEKESLKELMRTNKNLKEQFVELESQYQLSLTRLEAAEKTNQASEESNEDLEKQLNELRVNKQMIEIEAERGILQKEELKGRLNSMIAEISHMKQQVEGKKKSDVQGLADSGASVIFGFKSRKGHLSEEAIMIKELEKWSPVGMEKKYKNNRPIAEILKNRIQS